MEADDTTTARTAMIARAGWLAISLALALITGVIHAYIGIADLLDGRPAKGVIFIGMALPYFVGVAFIAAGLMRRFWLRVGLGYAVLLLVAWAPVGERSILAYADKIVEIALVVAVVVTLRLSRKSAA